MESIPLDHQQIREEVYVPVKKKTRRIAPAGLFYKAARKARRR